VLCYVILCLSVCCVCLPLCLSVPGPSCASAVPVCPPLQSCCFSPLCASLPPDCTSLPVAPASLCIRLASPYPASLSIHPPLLAPCVFVSTHAHLPVSVPNCACLSPASIFLCTVHGFLYACHVCAGFYRFLYTLYCSEVKRCLCVSIAFYIRFMSIIFWNN
jgi:hypothetical protein